MKEKIIRAKVLHKRTRNEVYTKLAYLIKCYKAKGKCFQSSEIKC
jgi:hypothetical protein